jgi:hypothetical protein
MDNMIDRSEHILGLRSEIAVDPERNSLEIEQFQNTSLRPVLKFQNAVIVLYFTSQLNGVEIPKSSVLREALIKVRFQKDPIIRNTLIGMVLGLLSAEELEFFVLHKAELTKRIVALLCQRLKDELKVG